jgi:hypothetical protein
MQEQHLTVGAPVFDRAGKKVGTLHAFNAQDTYLAVRRRWLFRTKDLYIALSNVSRSDAAGISLQVSKDDLKAAHYDFPWASRDHQSATVPPTAPPGGNGPSVTTRDLTTPPAAPATRFASLDE